MGKGLQSVLTFLLCIVFVVLDGIGCFAYAVIWVSPEQGMAGLVAARDLARRAPRPAKMTE